MIKTGLLDCQIDIYDFICDKEYFGVFGEYGVGKTLPILKFIDEHNLHALVIGKLSNVKPNGSWDKEIKKHTDFTGTIFLSNLTAKQRKGFLSSCPILPRVVLINYDGLQNCLEELKTAQFDMIVFDESTEVKNPKSKRFHRCKQLVENIKYRAVLTGSPITENYFNLWSQIYLLDGGSSLGTTAWKYYHTFFYKFIFGWKVKKDIGKKIVDRISNFCISKTQRECFSLPKRKKNFYYMEPSHEQKKHFKSLLDEFGYNNEWETQYIFAVQMKLRQVCSGFIYHSSNETLEFNTPKDSMLLRILESIDINDGVIIWCQFEYEVNKIHKILSGHDYSHVVVFRDKQNMEKLKSNPDIIVSTPAILGSGETLMKRYSIRYSHEWSFEKTENSRFRNYRRGSNIFENIVEIDLMIRDSIEEEMIENRGKKFDMVRSFRNFLSERNK